MVSFNLGFGRLEQAVRLSCSLAAVTISLALLGCGGAQPTGAHAPFVFDRTIVLPNTKGRIDHLAIDLNAKRLFVAEIANSTIDEVDLVAGKVIGRINNLNGPQGVAWLPQTSELVVASDDGTVRFFDTVRRETARIPLGGDADNVRIDPRNGHVVVGYGNGGLAVIDPAAHTLLARILLPAHPEGFQIFGPHAYVNVPSDGAVITVDLDRQQVLARWPTGWHHLNFPMAIAPDGKSIAIVYRLPAALAVIDTNSGKVTQLQPACGDADDVFWHGVHVLMTCGSGQADEVGPGNSRAGVATGKGARTGLLVPELDRLYVAVPAGIDPAQIRVFKPVPMLHQTVG